MSHPNRHALYQLSAQNPEADVAFFDRVFEELRGRKPKSLREDFAGSAYLSCYFVASDPKRTAVAVDRDTEALAWCRDHNLAGRDEDMLSRIQLAEADALEGPSGEADIVGAMNFGLFLLKDRARLKRYFERSRERLSEDGVFICEIVGGEEAIKPLLEKREEDTFTYVWEQEAYNPIDSTMRAHVHFEFPDGGQVYRAFSYQWRVWTLAELREVLAEVGFRESRVYWESTGEDGYGNGQYHRTESEEQQESWLCYLVAVP